MTRTAGHCAPQAPTAEVTCWCERHVVRVPWAWVGHLTASCGAHDCIPSPGLDGVDAPADKAHPLP